MRVSGRFALSLYACLTLLFSVLAPARANAQQWTALTNAPPGFLTTCVLLTDGRVMCHEYNTNRWRVLTPDINGSYANGTWSSTANMPNGTDASTAGGGCNNCTYSPLYYYSAVLPDGQVLVVGGEYNSNGKTWTNIGFLYNPVANTWSAQLTVPYAAGCVGDAQGIVLETGVALLVDSICSTNLASFDPATLTFTSLNPTNKQDSNNEEGFNILPDGRVLTVDSRVDSQFEIYDPATNAWTFGPTPVNLADTNSVGGSKEVGPGVLRPDGTLVYFSGNSLGQNAVYDTVTGTWTNTAAMDFPVVGGQTYHYAVPDGPASLLPNGNVLVMANPTINGSPFNTPSHFYEFDGTNLTQVVDSPNAGSFTAYQGRMLLLPTGQVLLTAHDQDSTQDVVLYSNGGGPQDAWRPVITLAPNSISGGNTYSISGRMFNGFSEGATYGDDAAMSTNYPLVRIRNVGTGHVMYARTHTHSRMGVQALDSPEIVTTQFDVPAGLESGPNELVVVTNGIPSLPIVVNGPDLTMTKSHSPNLFTQGDSGDTFTLTVTNSGPSPTSGVVTVVDTLPVGLTATNMAGAGWACNLGTLTCTRNDVLGAGASYPAITLTVDVANNAPIQVTNNVAASGGGEAANVTDNNTAANVVFIRQHTTTTVSPVTQHYHDVAVLRATVTPSGVSGSVEFFVNGGSVGLGTYNSATGVATKSHVVQLATGSYNIRAEFTSSNILYLDSAHTLVNGLTVTHEENTITYTGPTVIANGFPVTLSANLVEDGPNDDDSDGGSPPIAGRTVQLTLGSGGSAQVCNGVTNALGNASCLIGSVAQPLGPGTVTASFAGDTFYQSSTDTDNTILFAFLGSGSFTLGNLSTAVGSQGTFWDASWSTVNLLGGGAAPPSFKGFVNGLTTTPPACGTTWTTKQGGNSTKPPDGPLPSYMGVVVASGMTKSGSVTAGNISKIVVVQTNGAYGPAPGHSGYGLVVATYCQ